MDVDAYTLWLGRIQMNRMSLETAIRAFLTEEDIRAGDAVERKSDYDWSSLAVGDRVPAESFSDYSSLESLINRYNAVVAPLYPEFVVDTSLVRVRDALAHGRHFAQEPEMPMYLLKFSRVNGGYATVEFAEQLTEERLKEWAHSFGRALRNVAKAADRIAGRPSQF